MQVRHLSLTLHAVQRMQQRGIPERLVHAVLDHHDIEFEAGSGCRIIRVSRRKATSTGTFGIPKQDAEKLSRLALVYSDNGARVVTVRRDHSSRIGRRYRRKNK